jgi:heme-degrading monooxygenase HmoA
MERTGKRQTSGGSNGGVIEKMARHVLPPPKCQGAPLVAGGKQAPGCGINSSGGRERIDAMRTVITETTVKPGSEKSWDQAFEERAKAAANQPGLIGLSLLIPFDDKQKRLVVGIWEREEDWSNWHKTDAFQRTRATMNAATESEGVPRWHQVATEHFSVTA